MSGLRPSDRGPGLFVGRDVVLPADVAIGAHVVIHDGVRIGAGVTLQDGAIVGKRLVLGPNSTTPPGSDTAETLLGDGAAVGSHAVIVAGAVVAERGVVGDHALLREEAYVAEEAVVGSWCGLGRGAQLGARSRMMSYSGLGHGSLVEEDVFIGPRLTTTNDPTMGRHRGADVIRGITFRRGCRIGSSVTLLPGVEVGVEAVVGSSALVTRDVPPGMLALGVPARVVRAVSPEELLLPLDQV
jgi:acetyltransferase-like isoleucine patch superfamily enzyme